jgi:hypothetical protein
MKIFPLQRQPLQENTQIKQGLQKALIRDKLELQFLLLMKTQKMFTKTQDLLQKLWKKSNPLIVEKLGDPDPLVRWVATNIISRKRIPAEKELIERLKDPVAEVRTAARRALVRLSCGTDFGPQGQDSPAKMQQAIQRWTAWLDMQEPSTYRPGSSSGPKDPLDFDFRFGEKKKKKE